MVDHPIGTCLLLHSRSRCASLIHSDWPCTGGICQPKGGASSYTQSIGSFLSSTGICNCCIIIFWGVKWLVLNGMYLFQNISISITDCVLFHFRWSTDKSVEECCLQGHVESGDWLAQYGMQFIRSFGLKIGSWYGQCSGSELPQTNIECHSN